MTDLLNCQEAVVMMTYDDPQWGPDTVCGELFVRPFRRARQALKDNSND